MPKETISRITDKVLEEMAGWCARPLDEVYAAVFIDAVMVKVRDGQVANRPIYAGIGVTLAGEKDIPGLWAGTSGEGAKFWLAVLPDLRNRGIKDVFFVVCDGRSGSRALGPFASFSPVIMVGLLRAEQIKPVTYPADLMLGVASVLVCVGSVLNLIAVSDQWGRVKDLPWRARFVAVNRRHPRLRGTAMVCLMVALVFLIRYALMLFA